ncbi:hypothetical protein TWF192_008791 [Orbilia oligospora]|uniref:Uncharacterized protein n=1 Tax=Orbilia oligospora TaxID=2813651 RepID=A0A6G1M1T7_ORBOL|nr:hypothetical protein TWF191_006566 [Orbilia oligospora]KAF3242020.1 hypothetical protein TWF192_008791 [Orbilia oligospora]
MATPELLPLPASLPSFPKYLAENKDKPVRELLQPYLDHENRTRELFAQDPANPVLENEYLGLVPVYVGHEEHIEIRARNQKYESEDEKKYILPLKDEERKISGERAIVGLERFKKNFRIYSESALVNLDWNNVVAAGSSVMTALLTIPEEHQRSHKCLRQYYKKLSREQTDRKEEPYIDLFLYGLDEAAGLKKLEHIESTVRDNILWDMTCVRTRDTLTIVSKAPNRPIRIQLRLYSSISQLLHSPEFRVECACVAYDGEQIYTTPRGIASWMLQSNMVNTSQLDLLGEYESSLYRYSFRGFEVFYGNLHRNSIDPSIYKFLSNQLQGLAKLLAFERIPRGSDLRRSKTEKREVNGWEVSIKYGKDHDPQQSRFRKWVSTDTENGIYDRDLELNEWKGEAQKDRVAYLHRHPAFVGSFEYVKGDCCGNCPIPQTAEELSLQAEDDQHYVRGNIYFPEPPLRPTLETEETWADTAYVRVEDEVLHRAIAELDAEAVRNLVQSWPEDNLKKNVNRRSYTGKTPLQLAVLSSSPEIVDILIKSGARLTARLSDGRNSLHLAAARGDPEIVKLLLLKSDQNEELKMERDDRERAQKYATRRLIQRESSGDSIESFEDVEYSDEFEDDLDVVSTIHGATSVSVHTGASSFIEVTKKAQDSENNEVDDGDAADDVLDINMADRTYRMAPFHYAILHDNKEVLTMLVSEFGADILRLIAPSADYYNTYGGQDPGILPITLVQYIGQKNRREDMLRTLLKLGASSSQVDIQGIPAIVRMVQVCDLDCLKIVFEEDGASAVISAQSSVKHKPDGFSTPLLGNALTAAIFIRDKAKACFLLEKGVSPYLTTGKYKGKLCYTPTIDPEEDENWSVQPSEIAIRMDLPEVFRKCVELGVDCSRYTHGSCKQQVIYGGGYKNQNMTYLDLLQEKVFQFDNMLKRLPKPALSLPLGFVEGTYEYWLASRLVNKENERRRKESIENMSEGYLYDKDAYQSEKGRLEELKAKFEELVSWVISKGGKTYQERTGETESPSGRDFYEPTSVKPNTKPDDDGKEGRDKTGGEEILLEVSPSWEYLGVDDEAMEKAYRRIFEAAWNGDKEALKKEFLSTASNEEENTTPNVGTQNEIGDTILSIAEHRNHPKEFVDLIHDIATSQGFKFETEPQKPTKERTSGNIGFRALRITPEDDYNSIEGFDLIRDQGIDIKDLEEAFKTDGLSELKHSGMDFSEVDTAVRDSAYLGLSINGQKRADPKQKREAKAKEHTSPVICDGQKDQPIALYAAYHGSLEVLEWLETDGPELALRECQKHLEEKARLKQFDSENGEEEEEVPQLFIPLWQQTAAQEKDVFLGMLQRADKDTIKQWLGVNHPLLPHAVVLNPLLGTNKTDREKVAWYTRVLKFIMSRLGPDSINSAENSAHLSPLFLAASIRNKYAMEALLKLGADLHAQLNGEELNIVHNLFDTANLSRSRGDLDSIKACLDLLPADFKHWAFTNKQTKPFEEFKILYQGYPTLSIAMIAITYPGSVNLNSRNSQGDLPLHITAKFGSLEDLQYLLDVSTPEQVLTEDVDGMTVADLIEKMFYDKVIKSQMPKMSNTSLYSEYGSGSPLFAMGRQIIRPSKKARELRLGRAKNPKKLRVEEWGLDEKDLRYGSGEKMVQKVYREAVEKFGKRRILVSLGDVNRAYAANLEAIKERQANYRRGSEDIDSVSDDIVSQWSSRNWDLSN